MSYLYPTHLPSSIPPPIHPPHQLSPSLVSNILGDCPSYSGSSQQRSVTLVYRNLERDWPLPKTFRKLKQIVRNWISLSLLVVDASESLVLRIPTEYVSPQSSHRIIGPYIWLTSNKSYQLAITGAVKSRVEIFTDAYPPPDKPPLAELYGAEDVLSSLLPRLSHLDLTRYVWYESSSVIGHGGYCDVFVGKLYRTRRHASGSSTVDVAIKRLRVQLGKDKSFAKTLAREIAVWSRLDHANILPFLGYLLEGDYPSLVAEWMDNGTVRDFLQKNKDCNIALLALGIAKGVEYLHGQDIVHSDLKADNILINKSGEPLLCDFGISRMLDSSQTFFISTTHNGVVKGSTRWMAIELHNPPEDSDPKHSKETDIWAYGMTLYEMITKGVPYSHLKQDIRVMFAIMKGELPNKPAAVDAEPSLLPIWEICASCWETDPAKRIHIEECVLRLENKFQI